MKFNKTNLNWVYEVLFDRFEDERGGFIKTYNADTFKEIWFDGDFKESFYSISRKWVIRGMHFQLPPYDHDKFVFPMQWRIIDVILDLRKDSWTYGQYVSLELSEEKNNWVFIPKWLAHGFWVFSEIAISVYMDTTVYNKECDSGIKWDSFGFDRWIKNPIISTKDQWLTKLQDFNSPF
jgi:dTDP-4-dehydrorhamnose 3,5-epimerase/CDP-3, 6-dideoxy-D-glycero-D-glycero-4-hexulose-5-epimerase